MRNDIRKDVSPVNSSRNESLLRLIYAAVCLALCMVLPFLTGHIPQIGQFLSPMHIPVLLAGFLCGPSWALAVGFIAPILRSLLFQFPPYPTFVAMAFELAVYGLVCGLLYRKLPKKTPYVVLYGLGAKEGTYTLSMFLAGHFLNAWPGIVLHIVLIPAIVIALQKAKIIKK